MAYNCDSDSDDFPETDLPAELLQLKPAPPLPSDCCGGGCNPCVNDIYEQELSIWKSECKRKLFGEIDSLQDEAVIKPDSYTKFLLKKITQLNHNTNIYRFDIPGNKKLGIKVGQHLILRCYKSGSNAAITRQYTPISSVDAQGYFDVLIKLYETGQMSDCIRNWKEGELVEWRGPFGEFTYIPNKYREVVMIAAGSGITPMAQIISHVLGNEDDYTRIKLIYSCCVYDDILLKDRLDSWKAYWNFSVKYHLTREMDTSKRKYGDVICYERISLGALRQDVEFSRDAEILVLICGPNSFNRDIKDFVLEIGVEEKHCFVF